RSGARCRLVVPRALDAEGLADPEPDDHVARRPGQLLDANVPRSLGHRASFLPDRAADVRTDLLARATRSGKTRSDPKRHRDPRKLHGAENLRSARGADPVEHDHAGALVQAKREGLSAAVEVERG